MKTIGLIGGMSWESTLEYYRIINRAVRECLGGQHSAKVLLYSVDFHDIEKLQREGRWDRTADILADAGRRLERGGADLVLICTNTMHKIAPEVAAALNIPLVHIADATGEAITAAGMTSVGLLGTRYAMEEDFLKGYLGERFGLKVIVPELREREVVHRVIFDELCLGRVEAASRRVFARIIEGLAGAGAEGVILGCTEIPLLIRPGDVVLPVFDTTALHALKAVDMALS
jgi:aspartate racemase